MQTDPLALSDTRQHGFRFRDGMLLAICDSCGCVAGIPPHPLR
jgi:hypothetical protein